MLFESSTIALQELWFPYKGKFANARYKAVSARLSSPIPLLLLPLSLNSGWVWLQVRLETAIEMNLGIAGSEEDHVS